MRIPVLLAAAALCLSGCFVFDNPWDTSSPLPGATFQIVVSSSSYSGTYVWSPSDTAFEAMVGATRFYVYMDSSGYWCLGSVPNQVYNGGGVVAHSQSTYGALPPTTVPGWTGSGVITAVDDSAGGVSAQGGSPSSPVSNGQTLQVAFLASSTGNGAAYQWVSSPSQDGSSATVVGTGSTYTIQSSGQWIHVIVTPTDNTGRVQGTPVASQPVHVP
ncbi:MAG: hypothetical protein ACLQDL_13475 [Spirochaetia bacterium]